MGTLINEVCKSGLYYLHNLRRVRKYLSQDCLLTLIHVFVTTRLDYCNSLVYGFPQRQISHLQRLQNSAARLAPDLSKFCHTTPALRQHHWLASHLYVNSCELINVKPKSSYSLRSHNDTVLQYPQQKIQATLGARSFASAASSLCNKLPAAIRNATSLNEFKNMIETFIFNKIL